MNLLYAPNTIDVVYVKLALIYPKSVTDYPTRTVERNPTMYFGISVYSAYFIFI